MTKTLTKNLPVHACINSHSLEILRIFKTGTSTTFLRGLTAASHVTSTPYPRHAHHLPQDDSSTSGRHLGMTSHVADTTGASSGISSIHGTLSSREPTPQTLLPR